MYVRLDMRTPLWTGGVGGTCDRVHETGIVGSLRWWYEAIVRGLGRRVCDPIEDGCIYERKNGETHAQAYARLCDACRLFGCTGWKRRFRLSATMSRSSADDYFCLATLDEDGKFNHWWLSQVFAESLDQPLVLTNLHLKVEFPPGAASEMTALKGLLSLMAHYGGVGAKNQYGFGQFDWSDKLSPAEAMHAMRHHVSGTPQEASSASPDYYTLRDFWHLSCLIPENEYLITRFKRANVIGDRPTFSRLRDKYLPVSFDIRYKLPGSDRGLRQAYRLVHGKMEARRVFGTLKGDKRGSRVFVSHLYKENGWDDDYRLNVWGFTRPAVGNEIDLHLKDMFRNMRSDAVTGQQLLGTREDTDEQ
jgi:CRISPR-associated protein Cmr1